MYKIREYKIQHHGRQYSLGTTGQALRRVQGLACHRYRPCRSGFRYSDNILEMDDALPNQAGQVYHDTHTVLEKVRHDRKRCAG